jgi:hypothetical protein
MLLWKLLNRDQLWKKPESLVFILFDLWVMRGELSVCDHQLWVTSDESDQLWVTSDALTPKK